MPSALRRTWIGLLDGGGRRGGAADGVEHHEVVDDAVEADAGGAHARLGELAGVGLALVAQHVVLVDDDERLRQSGELVEARSQGRRGDLGALVLLGQVGVPEPRHALGGEERAVGELAVAVGVLGGVGDGVVEGLVHEGDVAALLGQDRERRGHVAADRVARDGEA